MRANSAGQPRYPAVNKRALTAVTYVCLLGRGRGGRCRKGCANERVRRSAVRGADGADSGGGILAHVSKRPSRRGVRLSHECTFQKNQIKGEPLKTKLVTISDKNVVVFYFKRLF